MTKASTANRPARQAHLQWVPADDIKLNPVAQREFRELWAQKILSEFDLDKFQTPHINKRTDGSLYVMEGQHSIWAYRNYFGEGQQVQVWLYEGLTEPEEAEFFLSLNNKKPIDAMARFKVGVTANRDEESDINRIVRSNGCTIGNSAAENSISAVGALTTIYRSYGGAVLGQTIRTIAGAFTEGGYERQILLGIAMVLSRYDEIDRDRLIMKLAGVKNGWNGLIQKAAIHRHDTGENVAHCTAAAVVEVYNSGRGGVKLGSWWSSR